MKRKLKIASIIGAVIVYAPGLSMLYMLILGYHFSSDAQNAAGLLAFVGTGLPAALIIAASESKS